MSESTAALYALGAGLLIQSATFAYVARALVRQQGELMDRLMARDFNVFSADRAARAAKPAPAEKEPAPPPYAHSTLGSEC